MRYFETAYYSFPLTIIIRQRKPDSYLGALPYRYYVRCRLLALYRIDSRCLLSELIIIEFEQPEGASIGGRNISSLRYILDSDTKKGPKSLVTAEMIESEKAGLDITVKKTMTVVISKQGENNVKVDIQINNETLEQVSTLKDLGQTITQDDKNEFEIKKNS